LFAEHGLHVEFLSRNLLFLGLLAFALERLLPAVDPRFLEFFFFVAAGVALADPVLESKPSRGLSGRSDVIAPLVGLWAGASALSLLGG
jgi:hypothetical protein